MFLRAFRRSTRRRYPRLLVLFCAAVLILDTLSLQRQFNGFQNNISARRVHQVHELPPALRDQKIFIAATHWNSAALLRSHWNNALLDLVKALGVDNVYISIAESGSWDDTKDALRELDAELAALNAHRTIVLDPTTHADEVHKTPGLNTRSEGWIRTPRSGQKKELRRIPYLARVRNLTLKPLTAARSPFHEMYDVTFDKILFLNDVVFTAADVLTLLATRNGAYATACALDYKSGDEYYDTFALRDSDGNPTVTKTFPYFRSSASRNDIMRGEPTRVSSCWNGVTIMDAEPFYTSASFEDYGTPRLKFRGINDGLAQSHLEGSECCLIHADNYLTSEEGVWVNPSVRVGYSSEAYRRVHVSRKGEDEDEGTSFVTMWGYVSGAWRNRFRRWWTSEWLRRWKTRRIVAKWKAGGNRRYHDREEVGEMCLINEMQVLAENGWKHL